MNLPEVFGKLHPVMKEDACDVSFFAILKTVFDASNELETEEAWDILDALTKQSKYEERANIFFNAEYRKKSKNQRIEAFKEFFSFVKDKIMQIVDNYDTSLYCLNCMMRTTEDNGLFEWIGPRDYNYKPKDKTCDNFSGFSNLENVNIKGTDFIGNVTLDIVVAKDKNAFTVEFNKGLADIVQGGMAVKVTEEKLKELLKIWYKKTFSMKMPKISKETVLKGFSVDASPVKTTPVAIPELDFVYDKSMLKKDAGAVSKEMRKLFSEKIKDIPIPEREAKSLKWAQKSGIEVVDYISLKNIYYPETDHDDILLMTMQDKLYNQALERVVKDAKKGRLDLSSVSV